MPTKRSRKPRAKLKPTTIDLPEGEEAAGLDAMALVKLLYFAGAQKSYPLLFATETVASQFEAAIGDIMQSIREQARPVVIKDIFENVRNFMLQDLQKLEMATTMDPVGAADLEAELTKSPLPTIQAFVKGSYAAVLRAIRAVADGTTFQDPDTCECEAHRADRAQAVTIRRGDA